MPCSFGFYSVNPETMRLALPVLPEPLRLLTTQADLQYHAAPSRGIFNAPGATKMGFWSVNPYIGCAFGCAYCYARDTHRYTLERAGEIGRTLANRLPAWLAFERRILVKEQAGARIRDALRSSRAPRPGDTLVIGSATDPYQPAERRFGITRDILETLTTLRGLSIVLITKSPLVTRDIPILRQLATHHTVTVHVSLITVDRDLARQIEPRAPTPDARLRAVRRLVDAGVNASVNCMPILPGITDHPTQLTALVQQVAATGVTTLGACALRLRAASRRRYLPMVRQRFPALASKYESTYTKSVHASASYRAGLEQYMTKLCQEHGLSMRHYRGTQPEDRVAHLPDGMGTGGAALGDPEDTPPSGQYGLAFEETP